MAISIAGSLLDACVLSLIAEKDVYGYQLTQDIQKSENLSESTLYPVLRRLLKENYLETYDVPHEGRNRRYYKITQEGKDKLVSYKLDWELYKKKVDALLFDKSPGES